MALKDLAITRFYAILDTGYVGQAHLVEKCAALIAGGAAVVQLRAKREPHAVRLQLLQQLLPVCRDNGVTLIVNDDLDAALAFDGVGLHIGQDDMPAPQARDRLGPQRVLGLSNHSPREVDQAVARANEGLLDYFAVGPVFATATKPDYTPVGLELVQYAASLSPPVPWVAIGGITAANAARVAAAGAPALVAVSEVLLAKDTAVAVNRIRQAYA